MDCCIFSLKGEGEGNTESSSLCCSRCQGQAHQLKAYVVWPEMYGPVHVCCCGHLALIGFVSAMAHVAPEGHRDPVEVGTVLAQFNFSWTCAHLSGFNSVNYIHFHELSCNHGNICSIYSCTTLLEDAITQSELDQSCCIRLCNHMKVALLTWKFCLNWTSCH